MPTNKTRGRETATDSADNLRWSVHAALQIAPGMYGENARKPSRPGEKEQGKASHETDFETSMSWYVEGDYDGGALRRD